MTFAPLRVPARPDRAGAGWLAAVVALALLAPEVLAAHPTRQQLLAAERARAAQLAAERSAHARAAKAQAEADRLAALHAEALAKVRAAEEATLAAAGRIATLAEQHRAAEARLALRAADITPLLPLLERLALFPAETMLAVPVPPEQAVRGALVLGGIVRTLEREARTLRAEQARVAALQAALDRELPGLAAAEAAQAAAAATLDGQLRGSRAAHAAAEDAATEAARRAAAEAARAQELKSAIARIEAERREAAAEARREAENAARRRQTAVAAAARSREAALASPAGPGLAEADRPPADAPVAGRLVRAYGEATEAGPATGLSYHAAPGARVVSPCAGRVVFAGPFRSFGLLTIVDCGGGYHFVLAGFARLDVEVGQRVGGGAPIGVMPRWDPRSPAAHPTLYVELRRAGQAVNPAPYLRGRS